MATFLATLFLIICVLLIVVVLLQKGRGGGLGAAFGGMGSSAFGTRVGDVFTWVTIILTALFLLLAILTTVSYRPAPKPVEAPTFTPPPRETTEPTSVTISCTTPGATIYYTLDGTEPTEDSSRYEAASVLVQPGQSLRARAFRRHRASPIIMGYYGPPPPTQPAGAVGQHAEAVPTETGSTSPDD